MTVACVDTSALVAIAFGEPGRAALECRSGTFSVPLSSNLLEAELRLLPSDGLEVEFLSRDGRTRHVGTLSIGDVLVLNRDRTRVA